MVRIGEKQISVFMKNCKHFLVLFASYGSRPNVRTLNPLKGFSLAGQETNENWAVNKISHYESTSPHEEDEVITIAKWHQ